MGTDLLKPGLNEVGLVNEPLFEVGQALLLQAEGLLFGQLLWVTDLGQEWRQVVNVHLLLPHLLLKLLSLLLISQPLSNIETSHLSC